MSRAPEIDDTKNSTSKNSISDKSDKKMAIKPTKIKIFDTKEKE